MNVYHFHMVCDEDEEIQLQDKMNWIFYNTTADFSEAPEGIREFLNYVQTEIVEDDFTSQLDQEIKRARLNEDWRAEYLKTYVNDMDMRREGYIEGEISKEKELINRWLKKGKAIAEIVDDLGKSEDYVESLLNS